jgi:hypothetical protein
MQAQKDSDVDWARWCINTQLMMRAMATDEAADWEAMWMRCDRS